MMRRRLALGVEQASPVQWLCPHSTGPAFESWPGACCCVPPSPAPSQPVSCHVFSCSVKKKSQKPQKIQNKKQIL